MSVEARRAVYANHTVTKAQERLLLVILAEYNTSKQSPYYTRPSQETIARDANMSMRNARRYLTSLEARGLLYSARKGPHPNAYFILLTPEGRTIDVQSFDPERTIDVQSFSSDPEERTTVVPSFTQKTGQNDTKDRTTLQKDRTDFDPLIGMKEEEKEEEKESPFPLSQQNGARKPQPDPNSANVWTQLCDLLTERYNLTPLLSRELRRARLDLWPQHNHADVILPRAMNAAAADVYAARFIDQIDLHLSDVTDQDWGVRVWTQAEIDAAEQEIHA